MPLSKKQIDAVVYCAAMLEQSDANYGEIRIIYKRPYFRHVQTLTGENLPATVSEDDQSHGKGWSTKEQ